MVTCHRLTYFTLKYLSIKNYKIIYILNYSVFKKLVKYYFSKISFDNVLSLFWLVWKG